MNSSIEIAGKHFDLLPERCAYFRESATLLCSDLHWGKAESLQRKGLAIPATHMYADLDRLTHAARRTGARRILILGDLIHAPSVLRAPLIETISRWRDTVEGVDLSVVRGNHDRQHPWPESWRINDLGTSIEEGPFIFSHDKVDTETSYVWTGHVHPMIRLHGAGDSLRLPCFLIGEKEAVLPAFTTLAGGFDISKQPKQRVFAIADTDVVEL